LIGNYHFAHDYGCVHPGMPLGRKHLRRSRDAPTGGMACKRTTSNLGFAQPEVNSLDDGIRPAVSAATNCRLSGSLPLRPASK
jgi:hypothetical protein